MMHTYGKIPITLDGAMQLLEHSSKPSSNPIHGYFITAHEMLSDSHQTQFLNVQATIIENLRSNSNLQIFVLHAASCYSQSILSKFHRVMSSRSWKISADTINYPHMGDCINDTGRIIIGLHDTVIPDPRPIQITRPPSPRPSIQQHLYK
eukprot:scaffold209112_cov28-Attheya_sp.AAC.1